MRGGGWGQDAKAALTCLCPQPPIWLRPAVLLHGGGHTAPDSRLHQWQHPRPWPRLGRTPIPRAAPRAGPLALDLRRHQLLLLLPLGARVLPLHAEAALQRLPQLPAPAPGWVLPGQVLARARRQAGRGQGNLPDPPPSTASAFGDPHFVTFDGTNFTFNGRGEYVLLEASGTDLRLQARAQTRMTPEGEAGPWGSGWLRVIPGEGEAEPSGPHFAPIIPGSQDRGTGLTAVAVQEGNSDVVEVRLRDGAGALQVLLNQEVLSFKEQSWIDLKGEWDGGGPTPLPSPPGPPHLSLALAESRRCPGRRWGGGVRA